MRLFDCETPQELMDGELVGSHDGICMVPIGSIVVVAVV